jgi:hypothetical protein
MFTSIGSRSRTEIRSISPLDMETLSVRTVASFRGVREANEPGISKFRAQAKTDAPE